MSSSSDRSTPARVARGAALLCSLTLATVVIVHAQTGCDAPNSTAPKDDAPTPAKAEPAPEAPAPEAPAPEVEQPKPANEEPVPEQPNAEAVLNPSEHAPVYMPASKSAGPFENVPLKAPPEPQQQQAQTPQQQAPHAP